jgi:GNAT superfamily N-acetyltransferase
MFDVPLADKLRETFAVELPAEREIWDIGLIVGPSGSGKSSLARHAYGPRLITHFEWPADQAIVDGFGNLSIKQITQLLTAVGLSSPPTWVKPYAVLSGGERFRCDLARALAGAISSNSTKPLIAFDEFTSVVDRNVAKVGSAAVAKAIRNGTAPCRFVAVGCHYDIAEWLEPDWVVDLATRTCTRRRLRRPTIEVCLRRSTCAAWPRFARHHYLSGTLNRSAKCYVAWWQNEPVAFCATLPVYGRKGHYRISRMVVLPDYQGIGLGMRVTEAVGALYRQAGYRFNLTGSHPAVIAHCRRSSAWRTVGVRKTGSRPKPGDKYRGSQGRAVVSFEYLGHPSVGERGA